MKHLTVGVAGHIDHGKTALVRALTGTETDRLKEEQARGMTIVLGFAHLNLPGGTIDFIDVPGHEKFVKTMIAGATGIDSALLIVAANERVKPQTVEHVALMGLLGVRQGLVIVTKSDLVLDAEERALAAAELAAFLGESFLRDAPLVFCSALTGEGLPEVQSALGEMLASAQPPVEASDFTLPIDRVFTITGQGTIVTGTLRRGPIRAGQIVEILPRGLRAEVRGLEVHGQPVSVAYPGWRTAVNLRGVKKDDIAHGDTLATTGALRPTRIVDAALSLLASAERPMRRGQAVALHSGTAETQARVYPLDRSEIMPGETALVQMRLSTDAALSDGEPYVVRSSSPAETIGGGRVIDPYPLKHTRVDEAVLRRVQILASGTPTERLSAKLEEAGAEGRDPRQLACDFGLSADFRLPILAAVACSPTLVLDRAAFDALTRLLMDAVEHYHAKHPTQRGMPSEELRRGLPRGLKSAAFAKILETLTEAGTVETWDGLVRVSGYSPEAALSPIEREIVREMEAQLREGGLKPPDLEAVLKRDRRRKTLYHYLVEAGALVPTTERTSNRTVVFHQTALAQAEETLRKALNDGIGMTVSELNQALGTTRKFSIPLLEHLDSLGVTKRDGNLRFWNGD